MPRPAIAIALPPAEAEPVAHELREAGFEPITVSRPDQLEAVLAERRDVAVAILDGETDFDESLEYYSVSTTRTARSPPSWSSRSARSIGLNTTTPVDDEYLTRPYSAESMRWRIEAMCIRSHTIDDGSGRSSWATAPRSRPVGPARDGHLDLQPEGRRREDDDRHEPRPPPSRSARASRSCWSTPTRSPVTSRSRSDSSRSRPSSTAGAT